MIRPRNLTFSPSAQMASIFRYESEKAKSPIGNIYVDIID
jgi:hypothetical protein